MSKDKIPGGLADGKSEKDFDKKKLNQGLKVEREHTSSKEIAKEIAMDHLTEDKNYYDKLKLIEKKAFYLGFEKAAGVFGSLAASQIQKTVKPAAVADKVRAFRAARAASKAKPETQQFLSSLKKKAPTATAPAKTVTDTVERQNPGRYYRKEGIGVDASR